MTIYCEDPHDHWQPLRLAPGYEHEGRARFWLGVIAALAVFWAAVGWGLDTVL